MLDLDQIAEESGGEFTGVLWWLRFIVPAASVALVVIGVSVIIAWGMV